MNKELKDKLAHYALREPKKFLQLDGMHKPEGINEAMRALVGDDIYIACGTVELMRGASVRILIPYDTDIKVAIHQIKSMAKWLKMKPELIEHAKPELENECTPEDVITH